MTTNAIPTSDMLSLRVFPISRQQYSLRVIDEALVNNGDALLRQQIARALQLGKQARSLELAFRGGPQKAFGDDAQDLRFELNRALGALSSFLSALLKSFGENSPQGSQALRARERLFPRGVRYLNLLPFVAQESTVRLMLGWTTSEPDLIRALHNLGAAPLVARVADAHARFAESLPKAKAPTYADVRRARREGHQRLCAIVFFVTTALMRAQLEGTPTVALREALDEVLSQNAAIGRYYARRRRVADVDPETGEEFEPVAGEAEEAPTAADSAEPSPRVLEAIEPLPARVADPWRPEDGQQADVA